MQKICPICKEPLEDSLEEDCYYFCIYCNTWIKENIVESE
jgi:hypothetical protein